MTLHYPQNDRTDQPLPGDVAVTVFPDGWPVPPGWTLSPTAGVAWRVLTVQDAAGLSVTLVAPSAITDEDEARTALAVFRPCAEDHA